MSYKVYVDDCGFKEYRDPYDPELVENPIPFSDTSVDYWRNNYFVLCGIRLDDSARTLVDQEIRYLKRKYFGTHNVEIKSNWMRIPKERQRRYIDPFGISSEELNKFGLALVDLIPTHKKEIKLFAVAVDKRYYKKRHLPENTPLFIATQALLERINMAGGENHLVFDQMEDSTSITVGRHQSMIDIYSKNACVKNIYIPQYTNISKVSFDQSLGENFLQLADICSYSTYRQLIAHGRIMTGQETFPPSNKKLEMYEYFEKICGNFHTSPKPSHNGTVSGYGLCIIPNPKGREIKWRISK